MAHPALRIKRAYEAAAEEDGTRLLVDRLWPRGVSKEKLAAAAWLKEIAPSTELRDWFGHKPEHAEGFRKRYTKELDANPQAVAEIRQWMKHGRVTLLHAARDEVLNNAMVLRDYLLHADR